MPNGRYAHWLNGNRHEFRHRRPRRPNGYGDLPAGFRGNPDILSGQPSREASYSAHFPGPRLHPRCNAVKFHCSGPAGSAGTTDPYPDWVINPE